MRRNVRPSTYPRIDLKNVTPRALISVLGLLSPLASIAGDLFVDVRGLNGTVGQVRVAVFHRADTFPNVQHRGARIGADAAPIIATFANLPPGDYAVSVYQDENDNGELDKNLFGAPIERYGFSRDARGRYGPPKFEDAKFVMDNDDRTIIVHLR